LELAAEQNRNFIEYLLVKAALGGTTSWSYVSTAYGGNADGRWLAEKIYSLYDYINKISNQIALTTFRGRANFLVCSLDVISKLETLNHWQDAPSVSVGIPDVNLGVNAFCGTLGRKYRVFCDMYATSDYIVPGYKGASEWDAGIFYCPYIPLFVKKGIGEEDGQPRIWFSTRYGIADNPFGAELYYRKINVSWS